MLKTKPLPFTNGDSHMPEPFVPELRIPPPQINWANVSKWLLAIITLIKQLIGYVPVPPVARSLWVLVLRETKEITATEAELLTSPRIEDKIERRAHRWRCCDPDGVDAKGKVPPGIQPYLDLAKGKPLPMLFLVAADTGDLLYADSLPHDEQTFLDLLNLIGG